MKFEFCGKVIVEGLSLPNTRQLSVIPVLTQ